MRQNKELKKPGAQQDRQGSVGVLKEGLDRRMVLMKATIETNCHLPPYLPKKYNHIQNILQRGRISLHVLSEIFILKRIKVKGAYI